MWAVQLIPTIKFLCCILWLVCLRLCRLIVFESVSAAWPALLSAFAPCFRAAEAIAYHALSCSCLMHLAAWLQELGSWCMLS